MSKRTIDNVCFNEQLNGYYTLTCSILHCLGKCLNRFHKILTRHAIVLRSLTKKLSKLGRQTNIDDEYQQHLCQAFLSFIQTFYDEQYQLEQRIKLICLLQITVKHLAERMCTANFQRERQRVNKSNVNIRRCQQNPTRSIHYQFVEHYRLCMGWKEQLDVIACQTTNLLWKFVCHSSYNGNGRIVGCHSVNNQVKLPMMSIEQGSGDQIITLTSNDKQSMGNSNNALIIVSNATQTTNEYFSHDSTDLDEDMLKKNHDSNETINDNEQWLRLVEQNDIQWHDSTTTDNKQSLSTRQQALHISDLSYTTDYYSQNDSI
jgi:hypothetical protein